MSKIVLFESKGIRRVWDDESEQWFFSVVDVVQILTDSRDAGAYWRQLKRREPQLVTNCHRLKMEARDGKMRKTDCAHTEGVLRIVQAIPSPKAEPFKQWLARVGFERIQEIENPELAAERARALYKAKGYPDDWIDIRLQSITTRNELTDEWQERGVQEGIEYAILTAEISKGTFDLTPSQHKALKALKRQNLRDHMKPMELILTMLGEQTTKEIAQKQDAQGFEENKGAAQRGGKAAGDARKAIEAQTGSPVVSADNFLPKTMQPPLLDDEEN